MDIRNNEIAQLNKLNGLLIETCGILAERCQRASFQGMGGLLHSTFGQPVFGVPTMGGVDPRSVVGDFSTPGFAHSSYYPYGVYPQYGFNTQSIVGWPGSAVPATNIDPFLRERVGMGGLSHTTVGTPWALSPFEIAARQRDLQAQALRQQYEAMAAGWRPSFGI